MLHSHLLTHRQAQKLNLPFGTLVMVRLETDRELLRMIGAKRFAKEVYYNGELVGKSLQLEDDYSFLGLFNERGSSWRRD